MYNWPVESGEETLSSRPIEQVVPIRPTVVGLFLTSMEWNLYHSRSALFVLLGDNHVRCIWFVGVRGVLICRRLVPD